jgi:hypothetical protein
MAANVIEGLRRFGIVLGVAGFCLGGIGSYSYLEPLLERRAAYRADYAEHQGIETVHFYKYDGETIKAKLAAKVEPSTADIADIVTSHGKTLHPIDPEFRRLMTSKAVHSILESETTGALFDVGRDHSAQPQPPRFWEYLLVPVIPLLGFLLPWGTIKILAWIVAGFAIPSVRNTETRNR